MRLVFKQRGANAGLSRHKGEGVYRSIGRKVFLSGVRKCTKEEADAINLKKKSAGKGIDVSTNTIDADDTSEKNEGKEMVDVSTKECTDAVDSNIENSVEESLMEGVDSFDEKESLNENEKHNDDEEHLQEKSDEETFPASTKRQYPPSVIDFLINNNTDKTSIPVPNKLQRFGSSVFDLQDDDIHSITNLNDNDIHKNERSSEQSKNHRLTLIQPTEQKKWPQKKCVYCRRKYGIRNDTRYICLQCNVALCKEPCFAAYHYATSSGMPQNAAT